MAYTAGLAVFLALAGGLTLAAFGWLQALTQRDAAVLARAGEETQRKQAELATDETRRRAYAAEISAAFQALDENNLERAIDLLDRQRPKPGDEDLRGFEWRHLWQLCQSDVKVTLPDADAQHPAFSPDGRWLAYGGKRIVIRELPSQAVVKTIPTAATTLAFSPDGKLLASGHDSHVRLWSTESWEEEQSLPDARYPAVFSPDGQWLVTGAVGGYRVWSHPEGPDVAAGGLLSGRARARDYLWQSEHGVAFSPDGRLLVTAGHQDGYEAGQFQVWDFPSLTLRPNFSSQLFELASAVFTPDSKHLLIGDQIGRLIVWDVAEGRVVEHSGRTHGRDHDHRLRARRPDHGDVQSRSHARRMGLGHAKGVGAAARTSRRSLVGGHLAGWANAGVRFERRHDKVMGYQHPPRETHASRMRSHRRLFGR